MKIDHTYHQTNTSALEAFNNTRGPEYWDYRKRWNNNPLNHIVEDYPIHLDIEATNKCNLACKMCPRTQLKKSGEFPKEAFFNLGKYYTIVSESKIASIKFNILGEPLLNEALHGMVEVAKQEGVIDTMLNTNALLLDAEMARKLIESDLDKIFFSIDSHTKAAYNAIRVGSNLDQVIKNIKRFKQIRDEEQFSVPLMRVSAIKSKWFKQAEFTKFFGPLVDVVGWVDHIDHLDTSKRQKAGASFCCPQLWQRMFIHPDGVVTPCCMDVRRTLKMGNVNEQTVKQIWHSEKYLQLRKAHKEGISYRVTPCKTCAFAISAVKQ